MTKDCRYHTDIEYRVQNPNQPIPNPNGAEFNPIAAVIWEYNVMKLEKDKEA